MKFKTKVKDSAGKTPVWNETFEINVNYIGDDITFWVMDEDVTSDDLVGQTTFKLSALTAGSGIDEWFQL